MCCRRKLEWWQRTLGLHTLGDVEGCLSQVEQALGRVRRKGLAGKTVVGYAEPLIALCHGCVDREYLDTNPLALTSGLRAHELRSLRVRHLDTERGGLRLDAAWTKNRKPGFQPLPPAIIGLLTRLANGQELDDRLLAVPSHPGRELDHDLAAAGIPKRTARGKIDFPARRNTFNTMTIEAGASVKEA